MAILEARIKGDARFSLRGIEEIHYTPEAKLQAILGTNGSGKSSLIESLSLCAPEKSYFPNGGTKYVKRMYRGHVYEGYIAYEGKESHFELKKDGDVIYSGHSSTAYANHVYTETRMTPTIHAVRVGLLKLTEMSTDARRKWFTDLSPNKYDYALGYYKRLTTEQRNCAGAVAKVIERLDKERQRLISAEQEQTLREEIQALQEAKAELMLNWRPMDVTFDDAMARIFGIDQQLEGLQHNLNASIKAYHNAKGYKNNQEIWDDIAKTKAELQVAQDNLLRVHESIEENRQKAREALAVAGFDRGSLEQKIGLLIAERDAITRGTPEVADWLSDVARGAQDQYDNVYNDAVRSIAELEEDPALVYTPVGMVKLREAMAEETTLLNGIGIDLEKQKSVVQMFEHQSEAGHTTCPKCEHSWIQGYSTGAHRDAKEKLEEMLKLHVKHTGQLVAITSHVEKGTYINQQINQIEMLARSTPALRRMWNSVGEGQLIRMSPWQASKKIEAVRPILQLAADVLRLNEEVAEAATNLRAANQASDVNVQALDEDFAKMEDQARHWQDRVFFLSRSHDGYRSAQKAMALQEQFEALTTDLLTKREDWILKAELASHHTVVNSVMIQIEAEINEKERIINQIDSQHMLIATLERDIEENRIKEKLLKKAMQALSPSEGLIARGLTGFINHFIAQMNAVIEKVWTYPLVVKPIKLTDDSVDLDYNFTYEYNGVKGAKDVKKASGAQKEIIDLAFMLVSMTHLQMDDQEIFLDEFSNKMDYAHRIQATRLVMDLVANSNFSQIFMISHYEGSYGNLNEADITVLCKENIKVGGGYAYNQKAKITYAQ